MRLEIAQAIYSRTKANADALDLDKRNAFHAGDPFIDQDPNLGNPIDLIVSGLVHGLNDIARKWYVHEHRRRTHIPSKIAK